MLVYKTQTLHVPIHYSGYSRNIINASGLPDASLFSFIFFQYASYKRTFGLHSSLYVSINCLHGAREIIQELLFMTCMKLTPLCVSLKNLPQLPFMPHRSTQVILSTSRSKQYCILMPSHYATAQHYVT